MCKRTSPDRAHASASLVLPCGRCAGTGTPLQDGGIAAPVSAAGSQGSHGPGMHEGGGRKGTKFRGLAAEDEELLAATEASLVSQAAVCGPVNDVAAVGHEAGHDLRRSHRSREHDHASSCIEIASSYAEKPRLWRIEMEMSKPCDEIDLRNALKKIPAPYTCTVVNAEPILDQDTAHPR